VGGFDFVSIRQVYIDAGSCDALVGVRGADEGEIASATGVCNGQGVWQWWGTAHVSGRLV
jgi:hypothetical protein